MNNPLSYQSTEYDCGLTTLINAIRFLFKRDEIPPEIIKTITLYSLDSYNEHGEAGKSGTTAIAMVFLSSWMNRFGEMKKFPIYTEILKPKGIYISQNSKIVECLQKGGAAVVRVELDGGHYVLLTGDNETSIDLFDSYYDDTQYGTGIEIIKEKPFEANRWVRIDILNSESTENYAFERIEIRECMLIYNTETRKTFDGIEYII